MAIGVDQIYLTMTERELWTDFDTGEYLTANVYTVDGVFEPDGVTPRRLSIGQLVMALCLQRAAELEANIIEKMKSIENTSEQLECMTAIENAILDADDGVNMSTAKISYNGQEQTYYDFLTNVMGLAEVPAGTATKDSSELLSAIESKMDEKNSFSQKTMIELQSQTNKRDQSYDMISNILKSLSTTLTGNANNM